MHVGHELSNRIVNTYTQTNTYTHSFTDPLAAQIRLSMERKRKLLLCFMMTVHATVFCTNITQHTN
jgi:hypothetical protein